MLMRSLLILKLIFILFFSKIETLYSVLNIELNSAYITRPSNVIDAVQDIVGVGFGFGLDIVRIQSWMMIQFRFDGSMYMFLYPELPIRTNFPLFLGIRVLLGGGFMPKWFVPYLESGYELRIKRDFVAGDTKILTHGAGIGIGVEFFPINFLYLGINFRVHLIDMEFFSIGPTIGFRL